MIVAPTDLAAVGRAAAKDMARLAEHGADMLAAAFAGARAIELATGSREAGAVAREIGLALDGILAMEIGSMGAAAVPAQVIAALAPHLTEIERAGRGVPAAVSPPPPATDRTYAAGIRLGMSRARVINQRKQKGRVRR